MSITTSNKGQSPNKGHRANKGQPQMDNVHKSLGFRTSRDPFQENSSQGIEGNKGKKFTPSRRVVCSGTSTETKSPRVCPLERDDSSRAGTGRHVRAGGRFLGRKTPKPPTTQSFCHGRFSDSGVTKVGLGDLAPKSAKPTATTQIWVLGSKPAITPVTTPVTTPPVVLANLAPKWSKPLATTRFWALASRATRTRFFDVLTARVFQEKKS